MSVIKAADKAVRCLQERQTEVRAQIDCLALLKAEIDSMTDVLELHEALHRLVQFSDEVLRTTQKVLADSIASAQVNRETAIVVAALERQLAGDQAGQAGRVVN